MTEWFVYCQRERTECYPNATRKAIIAGPYPTWDAADAKHYEAVAVVEAKVDGYAWFWTWGVCEAPAGTLTARFGVI